MSDKRKIELKFRTEGESRAYVEGYLSAVNDFIRWLKEEPVEQAMKTMLQISEALKSTVMEDTVVEIPTVLTKESVYDNPVVKVECSTCEYFLSGGEDCLGYCKRFNMRECHQNRIGCVAYKPKQ